MRGLKVREGEDGNERTYLRYSALHLLIEADNITRKDHPRVYNPPAVRMGVFRSTDTEKPALPRAVLWCVERENIPDSSRCGRSRLNGRTIYLGCRILNPKSLN